MWKQISGYHSFVTVEIGYNRERSGEEQKNSALIYYTTCYILYFLPEYRKYSVIFGHGLNLAS